MKLGCLFVFFFFWGNVGVDCIFIFWCLGDVVKIDDKVEGLVFDVFEGNIVAVEIEKRLFYFLFRVLRYDDEKLVE